MTDEQTILNHYNLTSPFPETWPAEKDESDASDDEKKNLSRHYIRRSKSRYSALERNAHDRKSLVPGSEKLPHGQENLVQKDEPDPLGGGESVVRILRKQGLPVEEDSRLSERARCADAQWPKLSVFRESILAILHNLLTKSISGTSPLSSIYEGAPARSRKPVTID